MPTPDNSHQEQRKQLEARLEAAEKAQIRRVGGDSHQAMAQGYRFLGEVVGGVFMGAAAGWALDHFAKVTSPFGLIFGLLGGAAFPGSTSTSWSRYGLAQYRTHTYYLC